MTMSQELGEGEGGVEAHPQLGKPTGGDEGSAR